MNLKRHFDNFKKGNLFSICRNSYNVTFDGEDGVYSYTLGTGKEFYNDGTRIDDITGVRIYNLHTGSLITLDPYPTELNDIVPLYNWTAWISNIDLKERFKIKVKSPLEELLEKIESV